ncbi:hypothetical protein HDU88_003905 [Geranomyces variabilis]|nr:hypothetical protein HDU88_003905 [Geranomyces variabilis]
MTTSSLQPAAPFTILIRNGSSSDNHFIVEKSTTIDQLMADANRRLGGGGRLVSGGTQLQTGKRLGDYPSIREGSEIQFIRGCIGGAHDIKTPSALPDQVSGEVKDDRDLEKLPSLSNVRADQVSGEVKDDRDLEKLPSLSNACIGTEDELGRLTQYGENFQKLKGVLESSPFKEEVGNLSLALEVLASLAVNELQTIRAVIDLYGLMTETLDDILSYKTKDGASIAALEPSDDVRKAVTEMNAFGKQFCSEVQNMFPSSHKEHFVTVVKARWLRKDRKAWAEGKLEEFKALLKKFKLRTLTLIYLTTESMHGKLETVGDHAENASIYAEKNHKILNHLKAVLPSVSPEEMAIVTIRGRMTQQSKDTDANVIAECRAHEPHARDNPFKGKTIFQIVDLDRRGVLWWAAYYGLPRTFEYVLHHTTIEDLNSQSYEDTPSKSIPGLMIEHPALQVAMVHLCKSSTFPEFRQWLRSQPRTMAYVFEELQRKLNTAKAHPVLKGRNRMGNLFQLVYCIRSITNNFLSQDKRVAEELLKVFETRSFEIFGKDQLEQARALLPVALVSNLLPLHTSDANHIEPHSVYHEEMPKISSLTLDICIDDAKSGDWCDATASLNNLLEQGSLTKLRLKGCGEETTSLAPMARLVHLTTNKHLKKLTLEVEDGNQTWDFLDEDFTSVKRLKRLKKLKRLRIEVQYLSSGRLEVLAKLIAKSGIKYLALVCKSKYKLIKEDVNTLAGALEANKALKYLRMDGFDMDSPVKFAIVEAFLCGREPGEYHDLFHLQFDGKIPLALFFERLEAFKCFKEARAFNTKHEAYKALIEAARKDEEKGEFAFNSGKHDDWPLWNSRVWAVWCRRHYETNCGVCQFYCLGALDGSNHTGSGDVDCRKHSWKGTMDPFDDILLTKDQYASDLICDVCEKRNWQN